MPSVSLALREFVRDRAGRRCEYCLAPEDLTFAAHHVDHIIALKHGGKTVEENLALCCTVCNRRKGSDLSSLDPVAGKLQALFHPRLDRWIDHFELNGGEMFARTGAARVTISLLRLNRPERIKERASQVSSGRLWTPEGHD